jgi:hypothetical protein
MRVSTQNDDRIPANLFAAEVQNHQRLYPGKTVIEVAAHFGMDRRPTDIRVIQEILSAPAMRRYRKGGTQLSGPVKAGPNRSQRKVA